MTVKIKPQSKFLRAKNTVIGPVMGLAVFTIIVGIC